MAFRAYLLIDLKEDVQQKKFTEIKRKIDALDEVDFVDAVRRHRDKPISEIFNALIAKKNAKK